MAHEHILTKDADGHVWVVVLDMEAIHLYPFLGRTAHNGDEERQQFERLFEKSFIGGISAVHYGHDCNTISYRPH
jgi:hypothetical protein